MRQKGVTPLGCSTRMVVLSVGVGGGGGYSAGNSFTSVSAVTTAVAVVLMATTESITIYFCGFFPALLRHGQSG